MNVKFDSQKIMSAIIKTVKQNHQIDIKCPKCGFSVGEHTMDEMERMGFIFCYNCDQVIDLSVEIS